MNPLPDEMNDQAFAGAKSQSPRSPLARLRPRCLRYRLDSDHFRVRFQLLEAMIRFAQDGFQELAHIGC